MFCGLIFLSAQTKIYKGAEYRTKAAYTYGRFDVRLKSAYKDGMLTSFFTYNDNFPNTAWNEIDIEMLGRYSDDLQFNPITPGQINHVSHYQTSFNPASDYHIYGFEWTPVYVAWFVDGVEVHRQTGAHIEALNLPQKIMMNVWNPMYPNWVGEWNDNTLPAFAYYDWVSYSTHTPGTGTSGTGNNFTMQWKDDFNSWDTTRWSKATHTWNGNGCDFIHENAVFQDGNLILCLTKETSTGFTDIAGPSVKYARTASNGIAVQFTEEVDPVSAQNPSNYLSTNPAMQVTSVALRPDSVSVFLTLSNYNADSISNMLIYNIKDCSPAQNISSARNILLIKSKPLSFPIKINCGGEVYKDYLADQEWSPSVEYGRADGAVNQNTNTVSGTLDPDVYKSELNGIVEYKVRVPNGLYTVVLMMAENYFTSLGKRKFSIAVQGNIVVKNLDIFAEVGKSAQYQRLVNQVLVTDGIIDIHFMAQIDNAVLNGIIVYPISAQVNDHKKTLPHQWNIGQNFPNPFNGATIIPVTISSDDYLTIRFYDMLGREVSELPIGPVSQGEHFFRWNGMNTGGDKLASGVYYYVVQGRLNSATKKLVFIQ